MASPRGCVPGGYSRRQRGYGRHERQQEAQAKPSDWFGCAPHPEYLILLAARSSKPAWD